MSAAGERLALWGLANPELIVMAATAEGVDLAVAATLIAKESAGRNVWGHDPVETGGAYTKGAEVTRAAYEAYSRLVDSGRIKAQGCGPAQLTYRPFQQQADQIGGCWDPLPNMRIGLRVLRQLQAQHGTRDGFRRYNGSGPAAEAYADDAIRRLAAWQARLGSTTGTTGDEVDMATLDELRTIVREELGAAKTGVRDQVWWAGVPDYYQPPDAAGTYPSFPAFAALGWSATHAAHARDVAQTVLDLLRERLDTALAPVPAGTPLTVDEVRDLISQSIAELGPLYLVTDTPPAAQ